MKTSSIVLIGLGIVAIGGAYYLYTEQTRKADAERQRALTSPNQRSGQQSDQTAGYIAAGVSALQALENLSGGF